MDTHAHVTIKSANQTGELFDLEVVDAGERLDGTGRDMPLWNLRDASGGCDSLAESDGRLEDRGWLRVSDWRPYIGDPRRYAAVCELKSS